MREASANNTSASVASASTRTVEPELERSIPSNSSGPTTNPTPTNSIAGVTGVPSSRRETAATPSSASATRASHHVIHDLMRSGTTRRDATLGDVYLTEDPRPAVVP